MITGQDVNFIVDLIQKKELVFFAGAGISLSAPSNLILFKNLQNDMIWSLYQELSEKLKQAYQTVYDEIDKDKIQSETAKKYINMPPEYIFESCRKDIARKDGEVIKNYALTPLNSLKNANPNLNHLYLSQFLLTGDTPAVFTTNFDLLLENALNKLSGNGIIKNSVKIDKHWKWEHFKKAKYPPLGQYFKVHGCGV